MFQIFKLRVLFVACFVRNIQYLPFSLTSRCFFSLSPPRNCVATPLVCNSFLFVFKSLLTITCFCRWNITTRKNTKSIGFTKLLWITRRVKCLTYPITGLTYRIYSVVSRGLHKAFFHHFMRLTIKGGLPFLFLCLIERYSWRSSAFPWLRFVDQTLFSHSILFSITCTSVTGGIMMNRRQL